MSTKHQVVDFDKVKATCAECNLSELCLPRGLHRDDLIAFEKMAQRSRPLHRGEYVFEAGDVFSAIYAVRSGIVKLYVDDDHGEERILGFYLPGELLGLDAIHSGHHNCSALAIETSSVCVFSYDKFEEACAHIHGLCQQMYRLMSREISTENELLLMLKKKTAEQRIAGFLVNLAARYQHLGYSGTEFKLPMSREEIGNYLGLTTETVSRLFSKMQRDNIIDSKRHYIKIKSSALLHEIVGDFTKDQNQCNSVA